MRAMIVLGQRMACLVAIAASAISGSGADAASFDCAKASSAMEHLVCGDAALGARDEIIARLYASASKVGKREAAVAEQRAWLGKAQACRTVACLADAYDRRNAELQRSEGGNAAGVDFFTDERDGASSTLNVVGPLHGFASASLTSTYVGAGGAEAGNVYAVATDAFLDLRKGPAAFADGPCRLTVERLDADRWKVSQAGKCELPGGTEFAGIYHRLP
ncbi:hypothetical protein MKK68_28140 [Methylobacterium sp. E-016]|uniref:lysozyme inhibitor LprI family protein n=1 Tax=Methylobacterium sp. E-016 TaxID=2836556 RepID=UPI001FB87EAA|nr:hypothetical protein [Methylobacterium sp. E-016]MCJ2079456.1 hypothetical protein [Methylobacterium sp. E-016]